MDSRLQNRRANDLQLRVRGLTEANHLGNVAFRAGKKLEWDAANLRATNAPEIEPLIHRTDRRGWKLI
jgi:hypothetical protein